MKMRINVRVKIGKNESRVIRKDFAEYEVWIVASPVRGAANKELIKTLANYFSVKLNQVIIIKGLTSPFKTIELSK